MPAMTFMVFKHVNGKNYFLYWVSQDMELLSLTAEEEEILLSD